MTQNDLPIFWNALRLKIRGTAERKNKKGDLDLKTRICEQQIHADLKFALIFPCWTTRVFCGSSVKCKETLIKLKSDFKHCSAEPDITMSWHTVPPQKKNRSRWNKLLIHQEHQNIMVSSIFCKSLLKAKTQTLQFFPSYEILVGGF